MPIHLKFFSQKNVQTDSLFVETRLKKMHVSVRYESRLRKYASLAVSLKKERKKEGKKIFL